MKSFFGIDSPMMRWLETFANLFWLNLLTILCCIPVFTAGAAFTALHAVCLKIVRREEGYVTKDFFRAFRTNFRQATAIWLLFLLGGLVIVLDVLVIYKTQAEFPFYVRAAVLVMGLFLLCTGMYVFPMQAKFENPVSVTIKNAFKAWLIRFPQTFVMLAVLFLEGFIIVKLPGYLGTLTFLFGFSFHAFISALVYNKFFLAMEERGNGGEEGEEV